MTESLSISQQRRYHLLVKKLFKVIDVQNTLIEDGRLIMRAMKARIKELEEHLNAKSGTDEP